MKLLMSMMSQDKNSQQMRDFQVEINPSNELIINLNKMRKEDFKLASMSIKQLYDIALFQSGIPLQGNDFAKRATVLLKALLTERLARKSESTVEEPVERIKSESLKEFKDDVKTSSNSDIFADFKLNPKQNEKNTKI